MAASMSPLVTRPSLPEPGTVEASIPLSAEILRTEGASGASAGGAFAAGAGAGAAATGGGGGAAWAGAAAGFGAAPAAPSLICPSKAPTATVSPSFAAISPSVPADGAGTSMVTLSVSSSTNGSPNRNSIPGLLEPAADGGLGHGFAERRNANFSHGVFPQIPCLAIIRESGRP